MIVTMNRKKHHNFQTPESKMLDLSLTCELNKDWNPKVKHKLKA